MEYEPTLTRIQREHSVWVAENFGEQPAWAPLLGMGEEYGEAMEHAADREEFLDAVGDFSIFFLHYLGIKRWDAALIWSLRDSVARAEGRPWPVLLGRLMHHELKTHQEIRGSAKRHTASGQILSSQLFAYLEHHCKQMGADYLDVVERTWAKVRQRDWRAHRAGEGDL